MYIFGNSRIIFSLFLTSYIYTQSKLIIILVFVLLYEYISSVIKKLKLHQHKYMIWNWIDRSEFIALLVAHKFGQNNFLDRHILWICYFILLKIFFLMINHMENFEAIYIELPFNQYILSNFFYQYFFSFACPVMQLTYCIFIWCFWKMRSVSLQSHF